MMKHSAWVLTVVLAVFVVVLLVQPQSQAGETGFNPDRTSYAPMMEPSLYRSGAQTAVIQSVNLACPRPDGFTIVYAFDTVSFIKDDAPYAQAYFNPRRLVPAQGDHFRDAKIALAQYCLTPDYLDDMVKAARLTGLAKPIRASVIQNTPTSIIVLTETEPRDSHAQQHILHGYFTVGSSLFEFACAATANTQPTGAAMFVSWLEQVMRNNR
ncbi:MAG: hypothetical protein LIP23_07340 [Planctomycetes bacterium]|nr:hypothetical protein [Planctomycetota bacterium]